MIGIESVQEAVQRKKKKNLSLIIFPSVFDGRKIWNIFVVVVVVVVVLIA